MMDTPSNKKRRRLRRSNASLPKLFLPEELIAEILSFLDVKTILRFKCVSKSWKALISDPTFIETHLKKSSQNPHLTLLWYRRNGFNVVPFPVHNLLKNPSNIIKNDKSHHWKDHIFVVGSCNGLLCLLFTSLRCTRTSARWKNWFRFWNPATRTRSKSLGLLCYNTPYSTDISTSLSHFKFTFGYDASTSTYKVVAFRVIKKEGEVRVFSLGNNCWRSIQSFPVVPLDLLDTHYRRPTCSLNDGVHFSGTVNWLVHLSGTGQLMIVSLDLSTESCKQLLPPPGFNQMPFFQPLLRVLMDRFCLSHSKKTEFVLWHMKDYGVQESWAQLFKISYQNLQVPNISDRFELACLYVNGDMAILADRFGNRAFIYNLKEKTVGRIKEKKVRRNKIGNRIQWFSEAKDYVESFASVC